MFIQCEQMKTYFDLLISSLTTSNFKILKLLDNWIPIWNPTAQNWTPRGSGSKYENGQNGKFPKNPGIWGIS